jgi:hypothetical protein
MSPLGLGTAAEVDVVFSSRMRRPVISRADDRSYEGHDGECRTRDQRGSGSLEPVFHAPRPTEGPRCRSGGMFVVSNRTVVDQGR